MLELNKIRTGTKFRVTWADEKCGLRRGEIVTVQSCYIGRLENYKRPRIKFGYIITDSLGFDNYVIKSSAGIIADLKRIRNHRGCHIKTMKTPFQNARYDARRMRRLARNACKFKKPGDDFYKTYQGIARNAGK